MPRFGFKNESVIKLFVFLDETPNTKGGVAKMSIATPPYLSPIGR